MIMSEHRIIPGHPNKYKNGHGVWIMPALMLPSQLQETMFEVALKFHGRIRSRKPAHLIFSRILTQLQPNIRALKRIESEVLLPMLIYKPVKQEYRIDEDRLLQIYDNKDLLHRLPHDVQEDLHGGSRHLVRRAAGSNLHDRRRVPGRRRMKMVCRAAAE